MFTISFEIVTDTSANLPQSRIDRHRLTVIPFTFIVNGEPRTCLEADGFDGERFYQAMREKAEVTTSQINPGGYIEYIEPLLAQGKDVLFVGMSSGISGAYGSSRVAAQLLSEKYPERRIRMVDTMGASLGEGIQVLWAAELRAQGANADEAADALERRRARMCQVFTVDDLKYLQKGGRISRAGAIVGSVLQIKPILKGNELGQIVLSGKVRGRRSSIRELAERYRAYVCRPEEQVVGIAHAGCAEEAERLADLLRAAAAPKEILLVCYEPVTGSHVGPGTIALFFEGDEYVRSMDSVK